MTYFARATGLTGLLSLLTLSACDVGNGRSVTSVRITDATFETKESFNLRSDDCIGIRLFGLAIFDDGTEVRISTNGAKWSVADATVATISNGADDCTGATCGDEADRGLAKPLATSSATIVTLNYLGLTDTATLTVDDVTLDKIQITPHNTVLGFGQTETDDVIETVGTSKLYRAVALFSDKSATDFTINGTWSSSDDTIAAFETSSAASRITAKSAGTSTVTFDLCDGIQTETTNVTVTDSPVTNVAVSVVTPDQVEFPSGTNIQLTARATYADGNTQDLADQNNLITWTTSGVTEPDVLNITSAGVISGASTFANNAASFTGQGIATFGGTPGSLDVTVLNKRIVADSLTIIPPAGTEIKETTTTTLTLTRDYEDPVTDANGDAVAGQGVITRDVSLQAGWIVEDENADETLASITVNRLTAVSGGSALAGIADDDGNAQTGVVRVDAGILGDIVSQQFTIHNDPYDNGSLTIVADTPSNNTQQLNTQASFGSRAAQDVTFNTIWESSDRAIASVDNVGALGLVTFQGTSGDTVTITAYYDDDQDSTTPAQTTTIELTVP